MRRQLVTAVVLVLGAAASRVHAQREVDVLPVQGNVFAIFGAEANTTAQVGTEGTLLVDAQPAALSDRILEAVRRLSARPIRHLVLTSADESRAGGAGNLSGAGRYVRIIDSIDPRGGDTRASIIAHLNVLNRLTASGAPSATWPTDTYFTPDWAVFSNGEAVQFIHVPNAHSDGDTLVFFRRSDVISTGAIFDPTGYPHFDPEHGGSVDGIIEGLTRVLDIAIPGENEEGGTVVVPGRGRLSDETDVANYRDMVVIIRDRVRAMVKKGASLDEVRQARLTSDYDRQFDISDGWTGDRFVEAIYRGLAGAKR
jgi:glyoxylase-like metal-dependent hydrolase (beta-lactamase superfamily II)